MTFLQSSFLYPGAVFIHSTSFYPSRPPRRCSITLSAPPAHLSPSLFSDSPLSLCTALMKKDLSSSIYSRRKMKPNGFSSLLFWRRNICTDPLMAEMHFISKSFCSEKLGQNRKYTSTKQHHNRTNQNRPVLFALNFADINTKQMGFRKHK